jgi:hypothetical protein
MFDPAAVERYSYALFQKHLLRGWRFQWVHSKNTAGVCEHLTKTISLSLPIAKLSTFEQVEQTLIHEIAHAIAGPHERHGPIWLGIAQTLGYTGGQYHTGPVPQARWIGTCRRGHRVERHRLTAAARQASCPLCSSTWSAQHLLTWKERR